MNETLFSLLEEIEIRLEKSLTYIEDLNIILQKTRYDLKCQKQEIDLIKKEIK